MFSRAACGPEISQAPPFTAGVIETTDFTGRHGFEYHGFFEKFSPATGGRSYCLPPAITGDDAAEGTRGSCPAGLRDIMCCGSARMDAAARNIKSPAYA